MLPYQVYVVLVIFTVPSQQYDTKIEWSLGSHLPISKFLDSGSIQDLYCSVDTDKEQDPIMLLCPLSAGICLTSCMSIKDISCSKHITERKLVYKYSFMVFKNFEGMWQCQYGNKLSRSLQITITEKPYIKSLIMTPNPIWKDSPLNITCQTIPMSSIININFHRLLEDNTSITISDEATYKVDQFTEGIIINSATPGRDDRIQCTVFTSHGIVTTKSIRTDIYFFPKTLTLTSSTNERKRFEVGSFVTFQCSSDNGNPQPILNIFLERVGEAPRKIADTNLVLTKQDNNAIFYCEIEKIAGRNSFLKSNKIKLIVNYPPEKIELSEEPEDQLLESQTKQLVCLSKGNSEPPSVIEWSMMDSLGKRLTKSHIHEILEIKTDENSLNKNILKSSSRIIMLRNYNGYSITCSIIYQDKIFMSQTRLIKVVFSPNHIALISNPLGAIPEGETVVLTCFTGSANPPSKILWFKTEPGKRTEDITSHSNIDMVPANYSGVAISSSLSIHGAGRLNHGTMYKCVVSHAYVSNEISKEYFLNVLFPPVIQVLSSPQNIEKGENVNLRCHTSGGNPSSHLQYNFQWGFCPVNISYQPSSNPSMFNKPSPEIRQSCSRFTDNFNYHQYQTLNISEISSKDRGWYFCNIRSPGGTVSGYVFLDVQYPPILTHQTNSRIYAKLGSNVILNADLSSNPTNVEVNWYFKPSSKAASKTFDQEISNRNIHFISGSKQKLKMKPFGRIKYSMLDNFTLHLSISSLMQSDYGDYFCEVRNSLGKTSLEFQLCPSDDISISESNIRLQFNGHKVTVFFDPPSSGHFSHMSLRICPIQESDGCRDMHISNPSSGRATLTLNKSPNLFNYRLLVFNGPTLLQITGAIQKDITQPHWVEMSIEMMIAVIIGVVGILVLLFVALLTLILLKCRRKKPKDNYLENTSVATTNSHQRRQDYMLLNSPQNTSLMKNGCHCFSNYPLELRSDNGSDHSLPSQNLYQPMMIRRKVRDNGEMSSIHSGGSCHSPDVVLTERTSINSSNNPMINGQPYPYSQGNGSTKVTLLSGRLNSLDGQRQNMNIPTDFMIPQEMIFAAVDDGMNHQPTRMFPISKNLPADFPLYFQMNNSPISKSYDMVQPTLFPSSMAHNPNEIECNNNDSRENSSTTNTDSNQDSATHDQSAVERTNNATETTGNDN